MGELAVVAKVAPGTATAMVKKPAKAGMVEHHPRRGVCLTPQGKRLASDVMRRNQLIKMLLVKVLKMDWSELEDEDDRIEHAMSRKATRRITALFSEPAYDLYGQSIPSAESKLEPRSLLHALGIGIRNVCGLLRTGD